MPKDDPTRNPAPKAASTRAERLKREAAALRANLLKRKAQARAQEAISGGPREPDRESGGRD